MRRTIAAAATAIFAVSMVTTAFADDVTVRTSVGSGEVVFTETSEKAEISEADLTSLVKNGIKSLNESEAFNAFVDAEASVTLNLSEKNAINLVGSAIGTFNRNQNDGYASFFYSLEGIGDPQNGKYESYHWVKDDTHYTAESSGNGWTVKEEDLISKVLEQLEDSMDAEEVKDVSLEGLLPNLYEENGEKYYVCLYNKDTLMKSVSNIPGAELYTAMAEGYLEDNDIKLIAVVNAKTGLLRAFSLDASGARGQLPGELLGAEGSMSYSAGDLYATILLDTDAQTIEIPEEVLNTPVTREEGLDLDLNSLLGSLGVEGGNE